ncbi:DnaB-like helicase N-terminal domain-containing protein [Streptomyces sp. BH105]|uniref:DnaB-like helicase N-terminal domain-containing protein n=1 Tax=Streptomyces sp. BH105 TaxID=3410408 RepID=UPI003CF14B2C
MKRLTHKAEEALLGAALFRPETLTSLRWIPEGAFSQPDRQELWKTLNSIDWTQVSRSDIPQTVSRAVDRIEDPGIRQLLTPSKLGQLVDACPNLSSAPLYGGMTLEAAIHRSVEHAGQHLRQTARTTDIDQAHQALDQAARTGDRFKALDDAWRAAPDMVRTLLDTEPEQPVQTAPRTERARTDLQAEVDTVASLMHEPRQMADVKNWLRRDDFSHPQLGSVYEAIRTLDERHAPIDPLTVAWEAQRHPGPQPSDHVLDQVEEYGTSGPDAFYAGERLLHTSALDRLDQSGHDIRNLARHPGLAPGALVDHADRALQTVHTDHERIQHTREPELAADKEPAPGGPVRTPELAATDTEMEI